MSKINKVIVKGVSYEIEDKNTASKALHYNSFNIIATADAVCLGGKSVDGTNTLLKDIPAATTKNAGVMTAGDKNALRDLQTKVENVEQELRDNIGSVAEGLSSQIAAIVDGAPEMYNTINKIATQFVEGLFFRQKDNGILSLVINRIDENGEPHRESSFDVPFVTTYCSGVMTAEDKNKLDSYDSSISELAQYISDVSNSIPGQIKVEEERAEEQENNIRNDSVLVGSLDTSAYPDNVSIDYRNISGNETRRFYIPAATETKAGVMTAEDKKTLAEATILALRTLYIAAGAEYNDSGTDKTKTAPWGATVVHKAGHYYLNGLGDISEEQMLDIYNAGELKNNLVGFYAYNNKIRTFIPSMISGQEGYGTISLNGILSGAALIESVVFTVRDNLAERLGVLFTSGIAYSSFNGCSKLVYIQKMNLSNITSLTSFFDKCSSLVSVKIINLKCDLSWAHSEHISKESVLYTIQNAEPKSAITITLHAAAYARLKNDADIVDALNKKNGYTDENGNPVAGTLPSGASINLVSA